MSSTAAPTATVERTPWQKRLAELDRAKYLFLLMVPGLVFFVIFRYVPIYGAMMAGDAKLDSFVMTVQIVTGERPLDYYEEWLEYYYANGGRAWEEHATRLYLK